jgi:hypothetical protein
MDIKSVHVERHFLIGILMENKKYRIYMANSMTEECTIYWIDEN